MIGEGVAVCEHCTWQDGFANSARKNHLGNLHLLAHN